MNLRGEARVMLCPVCGKPVLMSARYQSWACSDPDCVLAQSDSGPGGGYPLPYREEWWRS